MVKKNSSDGMITQRLLRKDHQPTAASQGTKVGRTWGAKKEAPVSPAANATNRKGSPIIGQREEAGIASSASN